MAGERSVCFRPLTVGSLYACVAPFSSRRSACASLPLGAQQGFYRNLCRHPRQPRRGPDRCRRVSDSPTVEEVVNNQLETGVNVADYYGQRVRALLTLSVTGSYTFWVAPTTAANSGSAPTTPASRRRIAYVSGWTSSREWTKEANQKSAPITSPPARATTSRCSRRKTARR